MNILLINQPLYNRGDESAHRGLVNTLLTINPTLKITVLFLNEKQHAIDQFNVSNERVKYVNYKTGRHYRKFVKLGLTLNLPQLFCFDSGLRAVIKEYKKADGVLCAPGGISLGGFQNWTHLFCLYLAKYNEKRLWYYGRSFGPFPTDNLIQKIYRKLSSRILRYCEYISIRDKKTEKIADEMGLKYVSTVDSAFLTKPCVRIPQEIESAVGSSKYVVFVPNYLIWHYNYKNRISKETIFCFFEKMVRVVFEQYPCCKVVMLPQTFDYNTHYGNDVVFFKELKEIINDERIIVAPDTFSSDIQQTIIQGAQCVVGARYHSVVFSLNNEVPFIALSYEHKIEGLLEALNKTDCMIDIVHAMDNNQNIKTTIELFRDKIKQIYSDHQTRECAHKAAMDCLLNFNNILEL